MTYRPQRMQFGIFLAPFHRVGENPTLALKRDLKLIEYLDDLGYDEAWIGEHHSYARELIADPACSSRPLRAAHAAHQAGHGRDHPALPPPVYRRGPDGAAGPHDGGPRDARRAAPAR